MSRNEGRGSVGSEAPPSEGFLGPETAPCPVPTVHGAIDEAGRCDHYDGPRDVVAIRCPRCDRYHPCYRCHDEVEDHRFEPWPADRLDARAVHCGACGTEMTIAVYLDADDACPACGAGFNPGCRDHHDRYFASES